MKCCCVVCFFYLLFSFLFLLLVFCSVAVCLGLLFVLITGHLNEGEEDFECIPFLLLYMYKRDDDDEEVIYLMSELRDLLPS